MVSIFFWGGGGGGGGGVSNFFVCHIVIAGRPMGTNLK